MKEIFSVDERLGIPVPIFTKEWSEYGEAEQQEILLLWENIRGSIPDRIKELEKLINIKQDQLSDESDFAISCQLNSEIANLASAIVDLWLWYRVNQGITEKKHT
ncbi:hypothetical protein ELQ35_20150 [Peribacillus cavernae]|uniref:Radical SAM protein n=1 Tax=Peribacillus cavernae TaxID=1674310 RepID=A0A433HAW0_9BACI|nr:hypothetical protein [Peribacillus cavernae]MDQ0220060.1 hypothetical protein [Peribacillus cavernae]RUQ25428.1 hypothetical protein ELQ35_20150 [Peribacillus cavernae]